MKNIKEILILIGIVIAIMFSIFIAAVPFIYPLIKIILFLGIGFGLHLVKKSRN